MRFWLLLVVALCSTSLTVGKAGAEPQQDVRAIKGLLTQTCVDMNNNKIDGTTWYLQPDAIIYDLVPPLISDVPTVQEGNRYWHSIIDGAPLCKYEDIQVRMLGPDHAFSGSIISLHAKLKAGGQLAMRMRSTDIWERTKGGWRAIHEHTSVPFNTKTGQALFTLPLNRPGR